MPASSASRTARVRQQELAVLGEPHLARGALEQPRAEPGLELADLARERLLGEQETLRRPREVELLGDRDEGAQQARVEIHHGTPGTYNAGR
jgi:hypothetical protein